MGSDPAGRRAISRDDVCVYVDYLRVGAAERGESFDVQSVNPDMMLDAYRTITSHLRRHGEKELAQRYAGAFREVVRTCVAYVTSGEAGALALFERAQLEFSAASTQAVALYSGEQES